MNIKRYCESTGRMFAFPSGSSLYEIRFDHFREKNNWTLLINGQREGDFEWNEVENRIKHLQGIEEYL